MARIGFVGLGMMGRPMARTLADAPGHALLLFDRESAAIDAFRDHPAWGRTLAAASSLEALRDCEVVITMLSNSTVTNAVVEGDVVAKGGLLASLQPGAIVADMGSSDPAQTARLATLLEARGITLLDAPVSGSVAKARTATLSIMVGGAAAAIDRVEPVLRLLGSAIIRTGAVGSAHAMKALNNYVYAAGLLAASEALLIAEGMGLDLQVLTDVLNASSGRNVATEAKLRQFILSGSFDGGFGLRLAAKDLATAGSLQALAGVDARQLALCDGIWKEAVESLPAGADNTALYQYLQRRGGKPAAS